MEVRHAIKSLRPGSSEENERRMSSNGKAYDPSNPHPMLRECCGPLASIGGQGMYTAGAGTPRG